MERTLKLTATGVWIVTSGCIAIGYGAWLLAQAVPWSFIDGWDDLFGSISVTVGVLVLLGGIFALKRRWWGMALLGAILSLAVFFLTNSVVISHG